MHFPSKTLACGLICLGALASGHALGQVSGALSLTNVRYVLIDLDPDDGIDPALTWLSPGILSNRLSYGEQQGDVYSNGQLWPNRVNVFGQNEVIKDDPSPSSTLAYGDQLLSSGSGDGLQVAFGMPWGGGASAALEWDRRFQLTPHTLVTFNVDLQGAIDGHVPEGVTNPYTYVNLANGIENAFIDAEFRASLRLGTSYPERLWASTYAYFGGLTNTPGDALTRAVDTIMTTSIANATDTYATRNFQMTIEGGIGTVVPSVPELSSAAQMALGGGLMLVLARIRHQRRRGDASARA